MTLREYIELARSIYCDEVWRQNNQNTAKAARYLGIHRNTLAKILKAGFNAL